MLESLNNMVVKDMVTTALSGIKDDENKEQINGLIQKFSDAVKRLDNNMVILAVKLNGKLNIGISTKQDLKMLKKPDFINVEDILEEAKESL